MILLTFVVTLNWFLLGVLLADTFVMVPNFFGCLVSAFQLSLFRAYPHSSRSARKEQDPEAALLEEVL